MCSYIYTHSIYIHTVNEPDLDSFVFMRVKEDIGQFKYNDDIEIPLASNDILAARYRPFKELLKDDGVELM